MKLKLYKLINSDTGEVLISVVKLTEKEANTYNVAYATNQSPERYIEV